jgi:hypothetical protein
MSELPLQGADAALAQMLSARAQPLADLVIDENVQRWGPMAGIPRRADQCSALHGPTHRRHALSHVARQVARIAGQLSLDCS